MATSRRRVLGLLGAAPVLAACGAKNAEAAAPSPSPVPAGTDVIMNIRHGEKPTESTAAPYGITADGERSDGSLTVRGWTRAGALVELFAPASGPVRTGLARPDAVYAAQVKGDKEQRPSQTVTPLATRLGVPLNTAHGKGDEAALAAEIAARHGVTLVSWQHEVMPAIVAHLGGVNPAVPGSWPDDRFDVVWVFTRAGGGWTFSQVPQLLLDGDRDTVIS